MIESAESERNALIKAGKITEDISNILSSFCVGKKPSDRLLKLEKNGIWIDNCFFIEFTYDNITIVLKLMSKEDDVLEFSFGYSGSKDLPIPIIKIKCLTTPENILTSDIQNIIERKTSLLHEVEHAVLDKKLPQNVKLTPIKLPTNNEEYKVYLKNPKELDAYTKQILLWVDQIINTENTKLQNFKSSTNIYNFLDSHGFFKHSKNNNNGFHQQLLNNLQQNWDEKNNQRILNKVYEQLKYLSELPQMEEKELDKLYDYYVSLGLLNIAVRIKTELEKRKETKENTRITFMKYGYDELVDGTLNETIDKKNPNEEFSKRLNKKLKEYFSDFDLQYKDKK